MSLLSDEAVNRDVAKWVKAWSACVFGPGGGGGGPSAGGGAGGGGGAGHSKAAQAMLRAKGSSLADSRPQEKVVLMCGPPGEPPSVGFRVLGF